MNIDVICEYIGVFLIINKQFNYDLHNLKLGLYIIHHVKIIYTEGSVLLINRATGGGGL